LSDLHPRHPAIRDKISAKRSDADGWQDTDHNRTSSALIYEFLALQSVSITHSRKDSQSAVVHEVRGMMVKGMNKAFSGLFPCQPFP
jgi:hypothetical protein